MCDKRNRPEGLLMQGEILEAKKTEIPTVNNCASSLPDAQLHVHMTLINFKVFKQN